MEVTFVKFQNLLEESCKDIAYGLMLKNGMVLCLGCHSVFEQDDYSIIEQVAVKYDSINDIWEDIASRECVELLAAKCTGR